jgi:hypothetical protein
MRGNASEWSRAEDTFAVSMSSALDHLEKQGRVNAGKQLCLAKLFSWEVDGMA